MNKVLPLCGHFPKNLVSTPRPALGTCHQDQTPQFNQPEKFRSSHVSAESLQRGVLQFDQEQLAFKALDPFLLENLHTTHTRHGCTDKRIGSPKSEGREASKTTGCGDGTDGRPPGAKLALDAKSSPSHCSCRLT